MTVADNGAAPVGDFYADVKTSEADVYKYYVDGEFKVSSSGKLVNILNPATNQVQFKVQACTTKEVDEAFDTAKDAQKQWARVPLCKRADYIKKVAALLRENWEPIAHVLMSEVAKGKNDSKTEVIRSAELMEYTAEEGVRFFARNTMLLSDAFPNTDRTKICLESKVPLGVVLCIPPFNYPLNLAVSKIGPALMAGNTVIMKAPTQGSTTGVFLAQCFAKAGVPGGVFNLVTGRGSEIGDYLTQHPVVNCISFTGGDTGISIAHKVGMVPVQMELGGKDVCIVCADADLDAAAKHIVKGGFSFSGQRCTAVKIVLPVEEIADALIAKIVPLVKALSVGLPEDNASITPVISESSAKFIEELAMDAKAKGATFLTEWKRERNLIWPCLVDHVTDDMRLAWEEPFGPLLPIKRIKTADEGVEHCNKSRLGLQGCVFTQNINEAIRLSDAMETGTIQINAAPARGPDHFPFQGFKDSGIGSQGVTNSLALMTKVKSTVINLPTSSFAMG